MIWAKITNVAKLFFDDKRYTSVLLLVWMVSTCVLFYFLGAFHVYYMIWGPSEKTEFMGMRIDTWHKWHLLAQFSFWNTAVNEYLGAALVPFFQNTIQDHKCRYLPYSKATCLHISNMYCVYTHIMSIFGVFLFFSQIDFLLIRLAGDLVVTVFTTIWWMQDKIVDRERHDRMGKQHPTEAIYEIGETAEIHMEGTELLHQCKEVPS